MDRDQEVIEYDLRHWSADQRESLGWWLRNGEVASEWRLDGVLVVPEASRDQVDDLVAFIDLPATPVPEPRRAPQPPGASPPPDAPDLASPVRRLGGYFIDGLVLAVLNLALVASFGVQEDSSFTFWMWQAVAAAYVIVPTARWGKTVGKLACQTKVTRGDGTTVPTLAASVVRWCVPALALVPELVLPGVGLWLGLAWTIAVYAPILGVDRQGLHDRAAGTLVVRDPIAPPTS